MRLVATISAFIVGAICATAARWMGIQEGGLVVAFAVMGAGIQSIVLICLYLYRTRTKSVPQPFGEPVRFEHKESPPAASAIAEGPPARGG
jgi:hypothetical protein